MIETKCKYCGKIVNHIHSLTGLNKEKVLEVINDSLL